jgi:hypothetical protein
MAGKPPSTYTPFLLKVDIEGAEKSLFTGPAAVLDQFPIIIMEPHDWMLPGLQTSVEFFRFHAAAGREFSMKNENVVSIAHHPTLAHCTVTPPPPPPNRSRVRIAIESVVKGLRPGIYQPRPNRGPRRAHLPAGVRRPRFAGDR